MIITVGNKTFDISIDEQHGKFKALVNQEQVDIIPRFDKFGQLSALTIDGEDYDVRVSKDKESYKVNVSRTPILVKIASSKTEPEHTITEEKRLPISAPMSGLVVSMPIKVGQEIKKGQQLLILEAMKMQNEIKSPLKAIIKEIFVKVGQTVEKDEKLLLLEQI